MTNVHKMKGINNYKYLINVTYHKTIINTPSTTNVYNQISLSFMKKNKTRNININLMLIAILMASDFHTTAK